MVKRCSCGTELKFLTGEQWVCMACEKFYKIPTDEVPPKPIGALEGINEVKLDPELEKAVIRAANITVGNLPKLAEGGIITDPKLAVIDNGDSIPLGKELSAAGVITVSDSNGPLTDKQKKEIDKIWELPDQGHAIEVKGGLKDDPIYKLKVDENPKGKIQTDVKFKEEKPIKVKIITQATDEEIKALQNSKHIEMVNVSVDFDANGKPVTVIFEDGKVKGVILPPKMGTCPRCNSETFSSTKSNYGYYDSTCHNCQFGWRESVEVFEQHGDIHPVGGI